MTTDGVNVRELALGILLAVTKNGENSHTVLSAVLEKYQYLSRQERGFLTRLTEGTLERQLELDYIIGLFSRTRVTKLKPAIREILRMGVYQLRYMNAVPASAACNEAVRLAGKKGFVSLKGFVNGVMRGIARNLDTIAYPDETKHPLYAWSIRYSIPEWILTRWSRDYGMQKAKSIAESFQKERRLSVRVNRTKTTRRELIQRLSERGITAECAVLPSFPEFDAALYLSGYDHLTAIPEFTEGLFAVQDISSMLVVPVASPHPGDYVIDVCSAPGGKSLHAADVMGGTGMVEARDVSEYKTGLIEENIRRCGMRNIRVVCQDARVWDADSSDAADVGIADLPCSGLGTLRKKPEIRYRMTEDTIEGLVRLQREILEVSCRYVKPGGTLVFSTCTIDGEENEENTRWFLECHTGFSLAFQRQFFPDEGEFDGFYIAKFIRE